MRVNFGCFDQSLSEWYNIDKCLRHIVVQRIPLLPLCLYKLGLMTSERYLDHKQGKFRNITYGDVRKPLPLASDSVQYIYTSHMLEHLYPDEAVAFLRECHRILRSRGLMRVLIPDLEGAVRNYFASLEIPEQRLEAVQKLIYVFFLTGRQEKHGHRWMYDFLSLSQILKETGFQTIRRVGFRQGECPDIDQLDVDPESLFVEAIK